MNIDAPETHECGNCKETINPEVDDCQWSPIAEEWFCWGCYESDTSDASTVTVVVGDGEPQKFYVADNFVFNQYGDEPMGFKLSRTYTSTDVWRGYYTTTIEGWVDALNGWTTSAWGDSVGERKSVFNDWMEDIISGDKFPPCQVAFVCDPTSNVFSTAITVLVPADAVDTFRDWLGEAEDDLQHSLS